MPLGSGRTQKMPADADRAPRRSLLRRSETYREGTTLRCQVTALAKPREHQTQCCGQSPR